MESAALIKDLNNIINAKTKPIGALGRLEEIALQVAVIQNTTKPTIQDPHIVVFAGDHGIASTGLVTPYPQEVTAQMVLNFIRGGAAINVFCRQNRIHLKVVDAGVNYDFDSTNHPDFVKAKIAMGTVNYLTGNAMTGEQAEHAVNKGREIISQINYETKCNCIGFGEMGIGNTSSASLIMSALLGLPVQDCVGKGTGANEDLLAIKTKTLCEVYSFHELKHYAGSSSTLLSKIGGFEIGMIAGAYLQAYDEKMVIVVDGFIATAALLLAHQIDPMVLTNCIFAHTSGEKGHVSMLGYLKAKPLLNLGLRLGEGTGAALAIPLIQSSVNFLNEMASFETAAVNNKCK